MTVSIQATGQGPGILGHIGSVEDVIAANLSPEMTAKRYRAADFAMGFELATPKSLSSMGEAVLVNGFCFANSTDQMSEEYDKTISGKEFILMRCNGSKQAPTRRLRPYLQRLRLLQLLHLPFRRLLRRFPLLPHPDQRLW